MLLATILPILLGILVLVFLRVHRQRLHQEEMSAVTRQHLELLQGGQLNEAPLETAKKRLRELLERGETATVEANLRPGVNYIYQIRALAEIGSDDAGRILERQLQRRICSDKLEQSWYWIDLANSLRTMNRQESLPHLLRCAQQEPELPLVHYFAAETVCFLGFAGYLQQADTSISRSALRMLHQSFEGLRLGVSPHMASEARLGEMIENLWDERGDEIDPLMVQLAVSVLRFLRRTPHMKAALADEAAELEAFEWQIARIAGLESVLSEYLHKALFELPSKLNQLTGQDFVDALHAVSDLRAEAGTEVLDLLSRSMCSDPELGIAVLTWSKNPLVGVWLRQWATRNVPLLRRSSRRRWANPPRLGSLSNMSEYCAVLRALRGHGSTETESLLTLAARDWDPTVRTAAVSSMGWWEPMNRVEVIGCLNQCRKDPNPEVRQTARAALARLGERQALQWFRQALTSEDPLYVYEATRVAAAEQITLLWPDLDRLADAENADVAIQAREALELMCEEMELRRSFS